jgi:cytochrome P450
MRTKAEALRLPPGPRGLPVVGYLPFVMRDPLRFYLKLSLEYGDVSHARLGPASLYFINQPDLIEQLLLGEHQHCIKDAIARDLIPLLGAGLLTNEGASWRKQRKLASPPLQPKRVAAYADVMVECAQRTFGAFVAGETRDFQVDMMSLTLDIVGRTLLGASTHADTERIAEVLETAQSFLEGRLYSLLRLIPASVPTPAVLRFRRARQELDAIVYKIIDHCREHGAGEDHLLARLLAARTEDGEAMSRAQLRDEVVTMMLAGHETTALVLMYAVYLLGRHPEHMARLRAEVDAVLGTRPATMADLPKLSFLDAVVRESLRLYPPAYTFGREVITPFELGGYLIPKGTTVIVSPFALHRNPRFFPEPERFSPERWQSGRSASLPRFAYFPFGGGPRVCIGNHFATMEAALILATLVQQVELSIAPDFKLAFSPAITLRMREGLRVKVERRR